MQICSRALYQVKQSVLLARNLTRERTIANESCVSPRAQGRPDVSSFEGEASFFLTGSEPAVFLSRQKFLHAQQITLAGTLNNPQQLSHRGDLLQLLLNEPLKEIVGRIIGLSLCHGHKRVDLGCDLLFLFATIFCLATIQKKFLSDDRRLQLGNNRNLPNDSAREPVQLRFRVSRNLPRMDSNHELRLQRAPIVIHMTSLSRSPECQSIREEQGRAKSLCRCC